MGRTLQIGRAGVLGVNLLNQEGANTFFVDDLNEEESEELSGEKDIPGT